MVYFTGCDSGFGYSLAKRLDEKGYVVFAGCLLPDREGAQGLRKECSDRLRVVQVDVTDEWQVRGALKYIKENIGDNSKSNVQKSTASTYCYVQICNPVSCIVKYFTK